MSSNGRNVVLFGFLSWIFIIVIGTVVHSSFSFLGCSLGIAPFVPVNESIWEHLKLVFFPGLIPVILGAFFFGKRRNYWIACSAFFLGAMSFIVSGYYSYTAIIGRNFLIADISLFVLGVAFGELLWYKALHTEDLPKETHRVAAIFITALLLAFISFTFYPPHADVFIDTRDGVSGIRCDRL
ncbi:MAG: DUF6512 family protein [Candidatus Colwellbacteria bacterium]|nr:DUF6512 family protein [Candidatus Colwellbacteria bacterium]